jgi:serine/threonine protein kinase
MELLAAGTVVERYTIDRLLGEGGMAAVYLARHTLLGSYHAIKVLDPVLVADEGIRDRFLAEGRIQAQVEHPNIGRVTDILSVPGIAALVMEYIEGGTLQDWIDVLGGPAPPDDLRSLFVPLLDAVEAVHLRGIIHRDLKPSNVLIGRDAAGRPRPVLLDFGIARLVEGAEIDHVRKQKTRTGAQLGTAAYMSPEQVRGEADLDSRTDIFALGAILYELVTGRVAFGSDSEFDTMRQVVDGRYVAPERYIVGLPARLAACIRRALESDRTRRFANCAEFRSALLSELDEPVGPPRPQRRAEPMPPSVGPPSAGKSEPGADPAESRSLGRWLGCAGGMVAVLALLAGAGLGGVHLWKEKSKSDSRSLAASAISMLQQRQTSAALNADPGQLDRALATARQAVRSANTFEAREALALLLVLDHGWHLSSKEWDEGEFVRADAVTMEGLRWAPGSGRARLARAVLAAKACRLLDDSELRRQRLCDEAGPAFDLARTQLASPRDWWLRVEAAWMQVGFVNALSEEAAERGDLAASRTIAEGARPICHWVEADLGSGSVNDGLVGGTCLAAAGMAERYDDYLTWARWLRRRDEAPDGALASRTVRMLYEHAGPLVCRELGFDRKNRWSRTFPKVVTREDQFCAVVGLHALDCPSQGASMTGRGGGLAWSAPKAAWSSGGALECYLTADIAGGR